MVEVSLVFSFVRSGSMLQYAPMFQESPLLGIHSVMDTDYPGDDSSDEDYMYDDGLPLLSARQRARPGSAVALKRRNISARVLRFESHKRAGKLERCSSAIMLRGFKSTAALKPWLRGRVAWPCPLGPTLGCRARTYICGRAPGPRGLGRQ